MGHVFISYKTEDRDTAQRIRQALRAEFQNDTVWWDQNLQTGGQWSQEIDAKLSSAACVVVLWSKLSVQSQWVQQEAAVAKALGTLTPAQIDDCVIPTPYAGVHAAHLINWQGNENDAEFVKLVARVRACLENHSSSRSSSPQLPLSPATTSLSPGEESRDKASGADARKDLKAIVENNLVWWSLGLLLTGFLAGVGAYEAILRIAKLETVQASTIEQLKTEIERLKKKNSELESTLEPDRALKDDHPNDLVRYYKAQILNLRGDIEGRYTTVLDALYRERGLHLAGRIGRVDEGQLKPAIKIIQHEYRGWAYLMGVSTYGETPGETPQPPEDIPAKSRIDYATRAIAEFDLALGLMEDIARDYRDGETAAIPIYNWMTGPSEDLNRTHFLKAIALAVIARANGGTPQAAIAELKAIKPPTYLATFPAESNPDLAWALQQSSTAPNKSSAGHSPHRFGGRTADLTAYVKLPGSPSQAVSRLSIAAVGQEIATPIGQDRIGAANIGAVGVFCSSFEGWVLPGGGGAMEESDEPATRIMLTAI